MKPYPRETKGHTFAPSPGVDGRMRRCGCQTTAHPSPGHSLPAVADFLRPADDPVEAEPLAGVVAHPAGP